MAVFEYKALNSKGRSQKGVVDADGIRAARSILKGRGLYPTELVESKEREHAKITISQVTLPQKNVNPFHLSVATRQLATLISAGIPLVEALKALGDQIDHPRLKRVIASVSTRVNEGSTMADAMEDYPKVFPRLYVNMIASGEASGTLDLVLERLADLLEAQADLRRKVLSASTYPILMLILCFGVIGLLLAYVIPEITVLFEDQNATLPVPTRIVIFLSDAAKNYWWALVFVLAGGTLTYLKYSQTPSGRRVLDSLRLRLPIIGPISVKVASSRFSRTLGTLLTSGVELLKALSIVKNVIGNVLLEEAVDEAIIGVREGKSLAQELGKPNLFPRLLTHMIAIGEKTGQLEAMLLRAAENYESEVNALIAGLTKILEPLLILFIAIIVGGILASVMLPMLEMSSLAV